MKKFLMLMFLFFTPSCAKLDDDIVNLTFSQDNKNVLGLIYFKKEVFYVEPLASGFNVLLKIKQENFEEKQPLESK